MITYDEFEQMVKEELSLLPDYVRQDLSGGVLIDPTAYLHPARAADDLYILGTYSRGSYMGNQIILYYGSFMAAMGYAPRTAIQDQVRETLRHEFLHHMETKAGEKTLVEEDRDRMIKYFLRHGQTGPESGQS